MLCGVPASGLRVRTRLSADSDFCEEWVRGHVIVVRVRYSCSESTDIVSIFDSAKIQGSLSPIIGLLTMVEFVLRLCLFCYRHEIRCKRLAAEARERMPRRRFDWKNFCSSLSDHQFRRMFRMTKEDFDACVLQ